MFFGGRPGLDEEIDFLSEVIPLAKSLYAQQFSAQGRLNTKSGEVGARFTLDIPVPYRIADLITLLDSRMGKLENRSSRMIYHKLITRIESVCGDPRYAFMFENANVGGDTMAEILATLFRLPPNGKPMTIMQLAGFPSEVVDAVVSVTCRMAFDLGLWSDGTNPVLLVCEEAHRYMAADHNIGFAPTRRAISRIAKEGRKYGVFLGLVTQRPAELDPTILSQCSTLFAMRMTNERDQSLLRSAVADTAANLLAFLPSLGTGEACLRRRRRTADAAEIQAAARQPVAEERDGESRRSRCDERQVASFAGVGRRALARPHRRATELAKSGRGDSIAGARAGGARAAGGGARSEPLQAAQTAVGSAGVERRLGQDHRADAALKREKPPPVPWLPVFSLQYPSQHPWPRAASPRRYSSAPPDCRHSRAAGRNWPSAPCRARPPASSPCQNRCRRRSGSSFQVPRRSTAR